MYSNVLQEDISQKKVYNTQVRSLCPYSNFLPDIIVFNSANSASIVAILSFDWLTLLSARAFRLSNHRCRWQSLGDLQQRLTHKCKNNRVQLLNIAFLRN